MYNSYNNYQHYDYGNMHWYQDLLRMRRMYPYQYFYPACRPVYASSYPDYATYVSSYERDGPIPHSTRFSLSLADYGPEPFAIDIEDAAERNENFRTTLWTGNNLQLTLMSLNPGEDIGAEMHPDVDQFVRIEEGSGIVRMGDNENVSGFNSEVKEDYAFIVPAGKWHNLINTGSNPLKLYSVYAPPEHPRDTVHRTKEEAMAEEH